MARSGEEWRAAEIGIGLKQGENCRFLPAFLIRQPTAATFPPGEGMLARIITGSAEQRDPQGDGIGGNPVERNKNLKAFSQQLRKNQTKEENLLWYNFLRKYPVRFRRQYIIGNYIVDFYCHEAKLVVELDGSQHYEPEGQAADIQRDAYLRRQGLTVLRLSNVDVLQRFDSVCEAIHSAVIALSRREKPLEEQINGN